MIVRKNENNIRLLGSSLLRPGIFTAAKKKREEQQVKA
jgi:hypothetical protein